MWLGLSAEPEWLSSFVAIYAFNQLFQLPLKKTAEIEEVSIIVEEMESRLEQVGLASPLKVLSE